MVGDRPATDGALAAQLGIPFALVLSGVTADGHVPADADPAVVARRPGDTGANDGRRNLKEVLALS